MFVILIFESLGFPLPGESLLIVASILAGRGEISLVPLLFSASAGAVIGDNIGYLIGRKVGHRISIRYGEKIGLGTLRLRQVEAIFTRYGSATVGFARFLNVLRQLNGIVAGALEMSWWRFLVFNAVGGVLWVLTWTMVGYYLGLHGTKIAGLVNKLGVFAGVLILIALLMIVVYALARRLFAKLPHSR